MFNIKDLKRLLVELLISKKDLECLIQEALSSIEINVSLDPANNIFCQKEYTCDPTCQAVVCTTCYNSLGELVSSNFTLPDGTPWTGDPNTLDPTCAQCNNITCQAMQESFTGDNATLALFNSIMMIIPKCCEITLTTSAGTIVLPAQQENWVYSYCFECPVSDFSIEGDCVDDVHVILSKNH